MRIIAGTARGRCFDAPAGMDTRPTLDRVKESMFGMLQFDLPNSHVLDLFSGSGNLGLEAASRGAKRVVCNDHARACRDQIAKNVVLLGFDSIVRVLCLDYEVCIGLLAAEGEAFDLILIDAPYADATAWRAADLAFQKGLVAENGRVVVEHASAHTPDAPASCETKSRTRRFGKCAFTVYERV